MNAPVTVSGAMRALDAHLDAVAAEGKVHAAHAPTVADQFNCTIVWMGEEPLLPGRLYGMKIGSTLVAASVTDIKHKTNARTRERLAAKSLSLDEIGTVNLSLDQRVPFDPTTGNREAGRFVLIDRLTDRTVGAGMLHFALYRSENIHWQAVDVNKHARAGLNRQKACVLWFTGLSGAGKSTIANLVEKLLFAQGRHTYLLDGDNVRHGLSRDLGFTDVDRVENIRRVAEVSKLMVDAGLIVLVSFISPFKAERALARRLLDEGEFLEVYVATPLSVAESRDPKGLYKKARAGELRNFTGISSPYEPPESPEITIDTVHMAPADAAELILATLKERGLLPAMPAEADPSRGG